MNKRLIFPLFMFALAGVSFAYGTWQYLWARRVQTASEARMAFIVQTIDRSGASSLYKRQMYATIFSGLPKSPTLFGIDFSGSFAGTQVGDNCANDGQRTICRALKAEGVAQSTITSVCGACNPSK